MDVASPERRRLGDELRRLRSAAGLSGTQLARELGISQAKVSRIETSTTARPSIAVVSQWLDAVRAPASEKRSVLDLAESVLTEVSSWNALQRGSLQERQKQLANVDKEASCLHHFQPLMVPGPLQTREYARAVISSARQLPVYSSVETDVEAAAQARVRRGNELRRRRSPQFHAILTETAIRWKPVGLSRAERVHQWQHLHMCARSQMTVQVIQLDAPTKLPVYGGFVWVEFKDQSQAPLVRMETQTAGLAFGGADEIASYRIVWDAMLDAALSPEDSLEWIQFIIDDIPSRGGK